MIDTEQVVGGLFRAVREKREMTVQEAAAASNVPSATIAKVEAGIAFPSYGTILKLSKGYDVDPAEFFIRKAVRSRSISDREQSVPSFIPQPIDTELDLRMLSVSEVSELLRISPRQVTVMIERGEIPPPTEVGRVILWRRTVIAAWINGGCKVVASNMERAGENGNETSVCRGASTTGGNSPVGGGGACCSNSGTALCWCSTRRKVGR